MCVYMYIYNKTMGHIRKEERGWANFGHPTYRLSPLAFLILN